jgi:hypothetical protein
MCQYAALRDVGGGSFLEQHLEVRDVYQADSSLMSALPGRSEGDRRSSFFAKREERHDARIVAWGFWGFGIGGTRSEVVRIVLVLDAFKAN